MEDLKIIRKELRMVTPGDDFPNIQNEEVVKYFVDDRNGFTVAEFKTGESALYYLGECPRGYSVRCYEPTEDEYLAACFENRRAWRYAHGMA